MQQSWADATQDRDWSHMTSNEEKDIDPYLCQTQIDKDLTVDATTKFPIINNSGH